jgi:hypothetical protein
MFRGFRKFGILTVLLLLLAGCGSDSNEYVVNPSGGGNAPPPAGSTGSLAFRFVQAQSATVPLGTAQLQFDFFDPADTLVYFSSANYAASVTVRDVPIVASRVVITAYGPGGVPLATMSQAVAVQADQTAIVDMTGVAAMPVTLDQLSATPSPLTLQLPSNGSRQLRLTGQFSNGDKVALGPETGGVASYSTLNSTVATVSADGTVTGVTAGNTTVTVSFTLNNKSVQTSVPVTVAGSPLPAARLVFSPPTVNVAANATTSVTVTYFGPGATQGTDVTSQAVGVSSLAGVSYANGTVSAADTITSATSATVLVTFNSGEGPVNGSFVVNVTPGTPTPPPTEGRLVVSPRSLTVPNQGLGALLFLPELGAGFFEAEFLPNGQTIGNDVTQLVGVSFKNFFPNTVTAGSFSYMYLDGKALVMTANPLGPAPPVGTTCTMVVSYIYNGAIYTDEVTLKVGTPEFDRVEVLGAVNGTIRIPAASDGEDVVYMVQAIAHYSNGYSEPVWLDGDTSPLLPERFVLTPNPSPLPAGYTLDGFNDTLLTAEEGSVTLSFDIVDPDHGDAVYTSFKIELVAGLKVNRVDIVPSSIVVEGLGKYRVYLTYSDNTRLDVTGIWPATSVNGLFDINCGCFLVNLGKIFAYYGVGQDELSLDWDNVFPLSGLMLPGLTTATPGADVPVNIRSTIPFII